MKKIYKKLCPICSKEIYYKYLSIYFNSIKNNNACRQCGYNKMIGRKRIFTSEHRKNISIAHKNSKIFQGVMQSKEYKEKLRKANTGRKHTIEEKIKISNANKGKIVTEEQRLKISNTLKKYYKNNLQAKENLKNIWSRHSTIKKREIIKKTRETNLKKYGYEFSNPILIKKKLYDTLMQDTNSIPLFSFDEYHGVENNLYKFKCLKCNNVFFDSIDNGHRPICKICFPFINGQSELYEFIQNILNIDCYKNYRKIIKPLEIDIFIPSKNIGIEYNGLYWHSEIHGNKNKNYHLNKTKMCLNKGIQLIHIFEDEWLNKKDIVKLYLRHIFNVNIGNIIYAKNCIIKNIDYKTCNDFLNMYHLEGQNLSTVQYGAYYNNKLISVMTFNKCKLMQINQISYELISFCSSCNTIGIENKLLKKFIDEYCPNTLISYANRRYNNEIFYKKLGFKKIKETSPNYWYLKKHVDRIHKCNFKKNILKEKLKNFNESNSEWVNMKNNGYDRIWDCGSYKFSMEIKNA